jgi:hypothetical protein
MDCNQVRKKEVDLKKKLIGASFRKKGCLRNTKAMTRKKKHFRIHKSSDSNYYPDPY